MSVCVVEIEIGEESKDASGKRTFLKKKKKKQKKGKHAKETFKNRENFILV